VLSRASIVCVFAGISEFGKLCGMHGPFCLRVHLPSVVIISVITCLEFDSPKITYSLHRGPKNINLFYSTVVSSNAGRFLQYLAHSILKKFATYNSSFVHLTYILLPLYIGKNELHNSAHIITHYRCANEKLFSFSAHQSPSNVLSFHLLRPEVYYAIHQWHHPQCYAKSHSKCQPNIKQLNHNVC